MKDNKIALTEKKLKLINDEEILKKLNKKGSKLNVSQSITKMNTTFKVEIKGIPLNATSLEKNVIRLILKKETEKFMLLPNFGINIPYEKTASNKKYQKNEDDNYATNKQLAIWKQVCNGSASDLKGRSKKYATKLISECLNEKNNKKKEKK